MTSPQAELTEWRDRAGAAEDALTETNLYVRDVENDLRSLKDRLSEYVLYLTDTRRGGRVMYRHDVAETLRQILDR